LVSGLTPTTNAYHEIWVDGQVVDTSQPEPDDLYGTRYLPRKFKVALAVEGDNCVDVYSDDLGLVAMSGPEGGLAGFNVLVGGARARTPHTPEPSRAVARRRAFAATEHLVETARAGVAVQRDFGARSTRRHARLKYLLADCGLSWFREQVQSRVDFEL